MRFKYFNSIIISLFMVVIFGAPSPHGIEIEFMKFPPSSWNVTTSFSIDEIKHTNKLPLKYI